MAWTRAWALRDVVENRAMNAPDEPSLRHDSHAASPPSRRSWWQRMLAPLVFVIVAGLAIFLSYGPKIEQGEADVGHGALRFARVTTPKTLPAIRFQDDNGKALGLEDFRGKVVLLNIWATWCAPCREEMPALDRLQSSLGGQGFEVVALSIDAGDNGLAAVKRFYAEMGIQHLRVYHDPSAKTGFQLGAVGVPTTLLLDRNGRELGRMSGAAEWDGAEAIALIKKHLRGADDGSAARR